jgi:hypothetical protein
MWRQSDKLTSVFTLLGEVFFFFVLFTSMVASENYYALHMVHENDGACIVFLNKKTYSNFY